MRINSKKSENASDLSRIENPAERVFEEIGLFLKQIWEFHFKFKYPEKNIIEDYSCDENDYGPILYVYQGS